MSQIVHLQKTRQARTSEELAWDALYRASNDPAGAAEVVEYLDGEPEVRKSHLALYLCCRQAVRAHEARRVRTQRIAAFLQLALRLVVVDPLRTVMRALRGSGDVAVELLPQVQATRPIVSAKSEPAARRVKRLNSGAAGGPPADQDPNAFTPAPASASASSLPPNGAQAFATVFKTKAD